MTIAIQVTNLTKRFGSHTAVDTINFDLRQGEIFGFLGQNGAGKTTTTRMLTGVIPPDDGTVTIFGYDIKADAIEAKQCFGVVPETSNAYTDLTAWQNIMLMSELYGLKRSSAEKWSSELLTMVGLIDRKDQKVQVYSKGMKQRLILAMALINRPRLLFLDEPTGGLDVQSTHMILSLLRRLNQEGTTIFLTTHNMEEANQLCHRVGIIRQGIIIAIDAPEKLKTAIEYEHHIEVSFDREIPGYDLQYYDGIVKAHQTGDKWQIIADNKDTAIRSIISFSQQNKAMIITLNTLAPTLDEAFIRLTQEENL